MKSDLYVPYIQDTIKTASKLFNIQGTPSTVLIHMQDKRYIVIQGAYPYEAIEEAYKSLTQQDKIP